MPSFIMLNVVILSVVEPQFNYDRKKLYSKGPDVTKKNKCRNKLLSVLIYFFISPPFFDETLASFGQAQLLLFGNRGKSY